MITILVRNIKEGVGHTGLKAGIIGEIGVMAPMKDVEIRSLRAAAAQKEIGY